MKQRARENAEGVTMQRKYEWERDRLLVPLASQCSPDF